MSRGGRTGNVRLTSGEAFRLLPVAWAHKGRPGDAVHEFDLNGDVAAALMDCSPSTLHTWATNGRPHARTGETHRLRSWQPYGNKPRSRRYYSLADLEQYAQTAWVHPRPIQYHLIPHWYLLKHDRLDLAHLAKPAPPPRATLTPQGTIAAPLPPEEQEALDLGYPKGAYVEHHSRGISVWSPQGVLLNPGTDDSDDMHAAAARELEWMRAQS